MTARMLWRWWIQDIRDLINAGWPKPTNDRIWKREGRMIAIGRGGGGVMGYPSYTVYARRGGFVLGEIEWRNQWGYYAFYPAGQSIRTPLNAEILAEIYSMLRELGSPGAPPATPRPNKGWSAGSA
jgi:hypothetical protein